MIKSSKKSSKTKPSVIDKKGHNCSKHSIVDNNNSSSLLILRIFCFRNIIILFLCVSVTILYSDIIKVNKKLKQIDNLSDRLESIQDKESKNVYLDDFIEKMNSFDKKYHEEILSLHDKLNIVNNKQKLRTGPYLVALTAVNHLKIRIDSGDDFKQELEILKVLDLSDKSINEFIDFASSRTKGIKTLNKLQKDYDGLVMNAVFTQKNFNSLIMSFPKFIQKLFYSFCGLIKIRRIDSIDEPTIDSILQKISVDLNNGNLKDVVLSLDIVKDKYTDAFKVLQPFYDAVYEKYKVDSQLSNIVTILLKNIYDLQVNVRN